MSSKKSFAQKTKGVQLLDELASLNSTDIGTPKEQNLRRQVVASLESNPYLIYGIGNAFPSYKDDKGLALMAVRKSHKTVELFSERLQNDPDVLIQGCLVSSDNILDLEMLHDQVNIRFKNDTNGLVEMSRKIKQALSEKPQGYLFDAMSLLDDTIENYSLEKSECQEYIDWIISFLNVDSLNVEDIKSPLLQGILDEELTKRNILSIKKEDNKNTLSSKNRKIMKHS